MVHYSPLLIGGGECGTFVIVPLSSVQPLHVLIYWQFWEAYQRKGAEKTHDNLNQRYIDSKSLQVPDFEQENCEKFYLTCFKCESNGVLQLVNY